MLAFRKNVYSQFGEDGIINHLLQKLNIADGGTCCEFGAWDGKHVSNTFRLVRDKGFRALYIEGDAEKYKDLLKTCEEYPTITPVNEMVSDNLDLIFEQNNFPFDIDVLSIDVDSTDYEIWKSTRKCNPKIVVIEPNGNIPSWIKKPMYSPEQGANYFIVEELGKEKGYTLACNTSNMIFVRNDLVRDDLDIDDALFPWHLDNDIKQFIFYLSQGNKFPDIPAEYIADFLVEYPKYCKGARLGFIDHTIRCEKL